IGQNAASRSRLARAPGRPPPMARARRSSIPATGRNAQGDAMRRSRIKRGNGAMNGPVAVGDVKDLELAREGKRRIEWADRHMPVLRAIRARFARERPLRGTRIAACLHVTTETANLARTLHAGRAEVYLCGPKPLRTQPDAAAALIAHYRI